MLPGNQDVEGSHFILTQEAEYEREKEVGPDYKPQTHPQYIVPPARLQLGSTSQSCPNLHFQHRQLRTKCSDTGACGWHRTFKPRWFT